MITNNEVNATFLSRYIAKKLHYGHRLKSLLNPLKREFRFVSQLTYKQVEPIKQFNKKLK